MARTLILLIRHGLTDAVGSRLVSRMPGIPLSTEGIEQAQQVSARLASVPLAAIYASPLDRTVATARAIAEPHGLDVQLLDDANEVEFGDWTGMSFSDLAARADWQRFNQARADAPVPNGERAVDVQRRIVAALETVQRRHPRQIVALVSHGDVIRNAVLHVAGVSIDEWHRFDIAPASISIVAYENGTARLLLVNEPPGRLPGT